MSADWKKATTVEMIRSREALDAAELLLKAGISRMPLHELTMQCFTRQERRWQLADGLPGLTAAFCEYSARNL
jgi:hypothetical protein